MQDFNLITKEEPLEASRLLLVLNDQTLLSNNAGTAFPTTNLLEGMLCYRTDLKQLWGLQDLANQTWILVFDLTKILVDKEYVDTQDNVIDSNAFLYALIL